MTEQLEYVGLVLEDQLLDHLATPEGATAVWRERLIPEVIPEVDQGIRDALSFVIEYMDEHREPPPVSVLMEETGYDEFGEPEAPIAYVIGKLRERYQKQSLRKVITKVGRLSGEPDEALRYGLNELTRIRLETTERGSSISSNDLLGVIDDYQRRIENPGQVISFGYPEMDGYLGGLRLGEITVVLARPKRYKSWKLVKSAAAALQAGHNVFFETMELTEKDMRDRFTCMAAGVSWYRFQHCILSDIEIATIETTARELNEWPAKIHFHRSKMGDRNVHNIVELAREKEAEVLYVDQLSWFDGAKDEGNWRIIGQIMEQLKDAAQHFPIYMAAQYNRAQAKEEGVGDLANIALADAIGQTADMLLGIYSSKDMLANKLLHFGVVESRSFEACSWEIKIELSKDSNFKLLNALGDDDD